MVVAAGTVPPEVPGGEVVVKGGAGCLLDTRV